MLTNRLTVLLSLLAIGLGATGCGGGNAHGEEASPDEVVDMWASTVCEGRGELFRHASDDPYGAVDGANCELDVTGTRAQKRQTLWVFDTPRAAETFVQTRNCAEYTYVSAETWVSEVNYLDIATSLVEAGGKLCE